MCQYADDFRAAATRIFRRYQAACAPTRFREKVPARSNPAGSATCLLFNERTANIEADWFANDFVVDQVGAKHLVIGDDFVSDEGARATSLYSKDTADPWP